MMAVFTFSPLEDLVEREGENEGRSAGDTHVVVLAITQ